MKCRLFGPRTKLLLGKVSAFGKIAIADRIVSLPCKHKLTPIYMSTIVCKSDKQAKIQQLMLHWAVQPRGASGRETCQLQPLRNDRHPLLQLEVKCSIQAHRRRYASLPGPYRG